MEEFVLRRVMDLTTILISNKKTKQKKIPRYASINEVFLGFISSLQVVQCPGKMSEALGIEGAGDIQIHFHLKHP